MLGETSFVCPACGVETKTYQSEFPVDRNGDMIYQRIFVKHWAAGSALPCVGGGVVAWPEVVVDGPSDMQLAEIAGPRGWDGDGSAQEAMV